VVFASAAAVGAGLAVAADQATGHADLTARGATASVAVPVALYLLSVWAIHVAAKPPGLVRAAPPCAAALVLLVSCQSTRSARGAAAARPPSVVTTRTRPSRSASST
jgi:hypothetical protein